MRDALHRSHPRARRLAVVALAIVWLAVVGGLADGLARSQASARRAITQRLAARAQDSAEFSALYTQGLLARELADAHRWLSARRPSMVDLENAAYAMGVKAAVLLDQSGHLLRVVPAKAALRGTVLTGRYAHLATAETGHTAVSNVVPGTELGLPVVGFAVPFATSSGRRVFSGAFAVAKTPLGAYVDHMINTPGHRVYLVDTHGTLISASTRFASGDTLQNADPALAGRALSHADGAYATAEGTNWFQTARIPHTPWRIVISVPERALFLTVDGPVKYLAWVALTGLAFAGLVIIAIGSRLARSHQRLATLNLELDRLARVDALTGVRNRRGIREKLDAAVSSACRHHSALAVLLIDIDHFKRVNDTHGHQVGDLVLARAAQTIEASLRVEDGVGRWGGEEFLAVLADTDADGALAVAERLRTDVAAHTDLPCQITVTVGIAILSTGGEHGSDDLIHEADTALYAGKTNGRNRVELFSPQATATAAPTLV